MSKSETCCALCMIDGIWSKPVDHWPYIPICQEHLTESFVRTGTERHGDLRMNHFMLTSEDAYLRAAASAALLGTPFVSLIEAVHRQAAEEAAAKIVSMSAMRRKLRPSAPNGVETDVGH